MPYPHDSLIILIHISSYDDDQYVYISYQYQAMMMINVSISFNDDNQCVYTLYPHQAMMIINVSISHMMINVSSNYDKYMFISTSNNDDDDQCV